uniref:hypothetical protein n=1 Tax=Elioraea rosea TaxID=2492390 RepID=UPI0019514B65
MYRMTTCDQRATQNSMGYNIHTNVSKCIRDEFNNYEINVLVVDDEPAISRVLLRTLRARGIGAISAQSADE